MTDQTAPKSVRQIQCVRPMTTLVSAPHPHGQPPSRCFPHFSLPSFCFVLPQSVSPLSAPQSSPQGLEITNDVAGYTKVTFYSSQNPLSKHTKLRPKGTPSSVQKKKKKSFTPRARIISQVTTNPEVDWSKCSEAPHTTSNSVSFQRGGERVGGHENACLTTS